MVSLQGPNAKYLERINELKMKLQTAESDMRDAVEKRKMAERDSANKDKDLSEAEEKLAKLESGEYGLADAVVEIKQLKQQVRIRDKSVQLFSQSKLVKKFRNCLFFEAMSSN